MIIGYVPLSISELGFAYFNDTGMWNIMMNKTHLDCQNNEICIAQLMMIFQEHAHCFNTQVEAFEKEREEILQHLKTFDANTILTIK